MERWVRNVEYEIKSPGSDSPFRYGGVLIATVKKDLRVGRRPVGLNCGFQWFERKCGRLLAFWVSLGSLRVVDVFLRRSEAVRAKSVRLGGYEGDLGLPTVPGTGTAVQKTAHGRVDNGAGRTGCRKSQELDGTGTVQRQPCTAVYGYNFTTRTYLNTAGSSTTTKHIVA